MEGSLLYLLPTVYSKYATKTRVGHCQNPLLAGVRELNYSKEGYQNPSKIKYMLL